MGTSPIAHFLINIPEQNHSGRNDKSQGLRCLTLNIAVFAAIAARSNSPLSGHNWLGTSALYKVLSPPAAGTLQGSSITAWKHLAMPAKIGAAEPTLITWATLTQLIWVYLSMNGLITAHTIDR